MLAAFLLGLSGSLGHCVGMCSGVSLLLSRKANAGGWRLLLLHGGRITTYALLGGVAGGLGVILSAPWNHDSAYVHEQMVGLSTLALIQGVLALLTALVAFYMAVALVGRAPSPEVFLSKVTQWWGHTIRRINAPARDDSRNRTFQKSPVSSLFTIYTLGMFWGLLPCGLVLAALLAATVSTSPGMGALTMVAFGLGTCPVGLGISLAARRPGRAWQPAPQLRSVAAVVILAFGTQMALRGLAAWGMVDHLHLGGLMVW